MTKPIFLDPTGRRARRTFAVALAAVAAMVAALVALALALTTSRDHSPIRFAEDADRPVAIPVTAPAVERGAWLPAATTPTDPTPREVFAFYMPWDEPSRRALADRLGEIDWVVPGLATIAGPDRAMTYEADPALAALLAKRAKRPRVLPMVQNAAPDGHWDGAGTAKLLADPAARRKFADALTQMVAREHGGGVMLDLENLPRSAHTDYRCFVAELRTRFAGRRWTVALAVPVADPDWDLGAYAAVADRLFVMAYDEHWMGGEAGPIASQPWFMRVVTDAVRAIGRDKAVVALGSYAYDWTAGRTEPLTIADAWSRASRARTMPVFDNISGTMHFAYREHGRTHQVWMLDAVSAMNQLRVLDQLGVRSTALWRLGSEDPGFWAALHGDANGVEHLPPMPGVTVTGAGEIMRLDAEASAGARTLRHGRDGLVRTARYDRLPSPDRVQRTGAHRRLVALTFDDGPDPVWTPRILDVLRREGVPATFFVTGASALGQGALLRRIVAEGSELGNHSTSHADLSQRSPAAIRLELTAAERLVEAYTGRTLRLFRPPFLGDADPDQRDELHATRVAAGMGYLTVGLNVDPLDWRAPGRDAIIARTIAGVTTGTAAQPHQVVLLHDSGGDRSQTLAALPGIIRGLRARGYDLVTVSTLAGISREAAMPVLKGAEGRQADTNRYLFGGVEWMRDGLVMLFGLAIVLGMARAAGVAALACWSRYRERPLAAAPHLVPSFVSVLIPAFNEARVIEASVRRVLASTGVRIEVLVIDDGSSDGTADIVARAFGIDPRVQLLVLENGGKARALNQGLMRAKGDIVIALDADTQFEPDTIARLTRWFADPHIGAVAGNAKIGNQTNLITRWQAIEYVTAQNIERRALAAIGGVTVVPGAIGAWRRRALDAVGGYPTDTLAEDQDLTLAIQRAGWRVACDNDAIAWTEAPETVRALFKQRLRWSYGTLQCLWKHRALIGRGRPRGLALIGLPQAVVFQLLLTFIAPLIDVALVASIGGTAWRIADGGWAAAGDDALTMAAFWGAFTALELGCGYIAYRFDPREERFPLVGMLVQRFAYRQILYFVVLRAVFRAVKGRRVGWGKLERSGSVGAVASDPPAQQRAAIAKRAPMRQAA